MAQIPDFTIIGSGIIGLSIAREILHRFPDVNIEIIEKENRVGKHASGRNSGVLHSGIYYEEGSLKAKVCAEGAREMSQFCQENNLPIKKYGKIIVPTKPEDDYVIDVLKKRAISNGASVEIVNEQQLLEIEPNVNVITSRALYSPQTSVVDSQSILNKLVSLLTDSGVSIRYGCKIIGIDTKSKHMYTNMEKIPYKYIINAAGLFADKVAHLCGMGLNYIMLPFKGMYYDVVKSSAITVNGLIYPVPDMHVPFLGIHFTKSTDGKVFVGPTAVPVMGRENYRGLEGINLFEFSNNLYRLAVQYLQNKSGFRQYIHEEASRFVKTKFVDAAKILIPNIKSSDLKPSTKVGIRAQLFDKVRNELVHDFVIEKGKTSMHVLNAVSPAFTSAFSFSRLLVDKIFKLENGGGS